MRVAIRVDASSAMGTGHLRRCLSLAHALDEQGASVMFVVRPLDLVAPQVLQGVPWLVHWLPAPAGAALTTDDRELPPQHAWGGVRWEDDLRDTVEVLCAQPPDWMVVDHYAFDARWHEALRHALDCRLLVIDDTADRRLDADALLDQNWDTDHRTKYADRLQRVPLWLAGPRFALLLPAYRMAQRYRFHSEVRSLGIFMGGTDPGGASAQVLQICREAGFHGPIEVVSTSASPHLADLRRACMASVGTRLTIDEPDLAAFFARHDLQIGAGGGATWERCCIGAPTIALALTANQSVVVPALDRLGALRAARIEDTPCGAAPAPLGQVLRELIDDPAARQALSEGAAALVDGRGAQRAALSLLRNSLSLRPATVEDARLLHGWRAHPSVRAVSNTSDDIDFASHQRWLQRVLATPDRWLFVAEVGRLPVGSIRFDGAGTGRLEVSLYLDPGLLGLGLGTRLLHAGEQAMLDRLRDGFRVDARVVPGNFASQRLFEGCGYHGGPLQYLKIVGPCR